MDAVINLWGSCLDRIRGVMKNISIAFTGDDPGATLLMIIFYLISIIAIILLLKLLSRILMSCFQSIFPNKKRGQQKSNASPTSTPKASHPSTVIPSATNDVPLKSSPLTETVAFLESFDEQALSSQLTSGFNLLSDKLFVPSVPNYLDFPAPVPLKKLELPEILSDPERAKITADLAGSDLNALHQMLDEELAKEPALTFQLNETMDALTKNCQERECFAEQENTLYSNYNSGVDVFLVSSGELQQYANDLAEKFSSVRQNISDLKTKRIALLEYLQGFRGEVDQVVAQVGELCVAPSPDIERLSSGLQKSDGSLLTLKNTYLNVSGKRAALDETIAAQQHTVLDLCQQRLAHAERVSILRTNIDALKRVEAERVAREEAERLAREDAARCEQQRKEAILASVQQQTKSAYTLNFDEITPDMYEKIASQINCSPSGANEHEVSPVEPPLVEVPPNSSTVLSEAEEHNVSDAPDVATIPPQNEPPVDHLAQLRKEWDAERKHKEAWDAEQAKNAADVARRKRELAQLLGVSKSDNKGS